MALACGHCGLTALCGVRLGARQRVTMATRVLPWALRHGASSGVDLMCVYYEREMERDLTQLRRELRLEPLSLS